MARRTNEQAQETREKILEGALNVFSEKGFSRATLSDIAKRIGMTRGAVYWHFKDKRELLVELIEAMNAKEKVLLAEKVPTLESLDDLLAQFLARIDYLETNKEFRKYIYFMSMQVEWATEKQIFNRLRDEQARNAPFMECNKALKLAQERGEIRPGVDLGQVFDSLVGMFTGIVRYYLYGMASAPLRPTIKMAMQAYIASIRA
ncbi:MAG: TetR family transcriptional regulator [Deltaproteobacteria bacterium]|nr:TetR family transcriptional regulator [Deltaproteobacteria bacterium]